MRSPKINQTFLLNNGKWYEIEKDFANTINDNFKKFRDIDFDYSLPEYTIKMKQIIIKKLQKIMKIFFVWIEKQLCRHGKIEFCDIFTKDNVWIKRENFQQLCL